MFRFDLQFLQNLHYDNIIILAGELIVYGGWVVILYYLWPHIKDYWMNWRQGKFAAENTSVILKLKIPALDIRDIEAIEQVFVQIHGSRRTPTWWEIWWKGQYNLSYSFEIEGKEGQITYYVRCAKKLQNLTEAALYAQYPDIEIEELKNEDDYTKQTAIERFPDPNYEMLGSEYVLVKPFYYPLKTYRHFYNPKKDIYLDPMRHFLEMMSNLKQGENIWYHLMLIPEYDTWQERGEELIKSIMEKFAQTVKGKTPGMIRMVLKEILDIIKRLLLSPLGLLKEAQDQLITNSVKEIKKQIARGVIPEFRQQLLGGNKYHYSDELDKTAQISSEPIINAAAPNVNIEKTGFTAYNQLPTNERNKIEGISQKISKLGFKAKIRVIYLAKHPVFTKFRFWSEIHGSFKHFSDFQLNSLTRGRYSKTTADYAFADKRKLMRKNAIFSRAQGRDWFAGDEWMVLNTEEIATLWHFPHRNDQYSPILINKKSVPKRKPGDSWRSREGYDPGNLITEMRGAVPEGLPVEDDKPLAYK